MYVISVLVSGTGTTLDNLAFHCHDDFEGVLKGKVTIGSVVADRKCEAIEIADGWGIPNFVLEPDSEVYKTKFDDPHQLWSYDMMGEGDAYYGNRYNLWVMAGFLSKIYVHEEYEGRILNIHPSLLPKHGGEGMYGRKVHESVIAAGDLESGCSVHVVDNEYDHGEVIAQKKLKVLPWESADVLEANVKKLEKDLYPRAILEYLQNNDFPMGGNIKKHHIDAK